MVNVYVKGMHVGTVEASTEEIKEYVNNGFVVKRA